MTLPLVPPVLPQLARSAKTLPGGDYSYEPKWDGFRSIAFVDGDDVYLQSRNGKPLSRYFPELSFPAGRYVLDGEIVLFDEQGRQDFDALGQRVHPAESRIKMLAEKTPTRFIAFDVLADGDEVLLDLPQHERRTRLEKLIDAPVDITPVVFDPAGAQDWLQGAEGVMAKELSAPYRPGERTGMVKIKRVRTIDAVVMGWRPGKEEGTVGSLILGLHGDDGRLRAVGHTSGFSAKEKRELPARLAPYETGKRGMGDPSRWANERELEWIELRPELVVEVTFDHTSNDRIRHGAKIARWREDKPPAECLTDQLLRSQSYTMRGRRLRAGRDLLGLHARVVEVLLVLEAPPGERAERDQQVLTDGRQLVLDARRDARVDVPLDDPVALELAQRRAQHPAGDAVDLPQQLVEAVRALPELGEHDDTPLRRQHPDSALQRL